MRPGRAIGRDDQVRVSDVSWTSGKRPVGRGEDVGLVRRSHQLETGSNNDTS